MKRFLIAAALALGLASCAQLQNAYQVVTGAAVTPQQVYVSANAFDAIEATATQYLRLPPCGSFPCRNAGAVKVIVPAVRSGRLARNQLEAAISANPGAPVNANLLATLESSTFTLKAILAEYKVQ